MKRSITLIIALCILSISQSLYSAPGLSVGVFGAYSIDGGSIEDSIKDKRTQEFNYDDPAITKSEYDTVVIPGCGIFATYQFKSGLSIRGGAEYYKLASGDDVAKTIHNSYSGYNEFYNYKFQYEATAFPILFGFSASPDRGRTYLYIYAGLISSLVQIERETNIYYTSGNNMVYSSENKKIITGFAGIIGGEKRITNSISAVIEYAFYKCEKDSIENGKYIVNNVSYISYKYTENYGLPRQQARVGVKYQF